MQFRYLNSISDIDSHSWNQVSDTDYPFTRHEFLSSLENSGAATQKTGWQPHHLTVYHNDSLVAVMPLYIKEHSYGEYMFDWSWADAYHRQGLAYYPKLLAAIPFTPATGPRLCIDKSASQDAIYPAVANELIQHCQQLELSSAHVLFPRQSEHEHLNNQLSQRRGVQFHWFNQGFTDFDGFLTTFNSRKRKALKKERRSIEQQHVSLERLTGKDISVEIWQQFYLFYQVTYAKKSGHGGYLTQAFFQQIAKSLPDQIMLVIAKKGDRIIAGALNFFDSQTLYGRYWGCIEEVEFLHFEACYYQGIEFCIERGLQRFDPGAQGEHKIQRGFTPVYVYSYHWLAHPEFNQAINQFLQQETTELKRYKQQCFGQLPFKKV
jgi:predicted N-acyltransferase